MPRGGYRRGAPGKAYAQRTDMNQNRQPVQAAAGQAYGERQAQEQAQRAVPLPAAPPVQTPPPSSAPGALPGSFGDFLRPTERPNEPLTAGLPVGPGPGPEAVRVAPNPQGDVEAQILALYRQSPNNDLLRLLRTVRARAASPELFGGA